MAKRRKLVCMACDKPIEVDDKAEVFHDAEGRMIVHRLCAIRAVRLSVAVQEDEQYTEEHATVTPEQRRLSMVRKLNLCSRAIASVAELLTKEPASRG